MKKLSEAAQADDAFKAYCGKCAENKSVYHFNEKRGICNLCVSKEDATINMTLVKRRRAHEDLRDMLRYDTSLESLVP